MSATEFNIHAKATLPNPPPESAETDLDRAGQELPATETIVKGEQGSSDNFRYECAWCKKFLRGNINGTHLSHGICAECRDQIRAGKDPKQS